MNFKLLILLFSLTLISFVDSSFADQKQSQTSINRPAKEKSNEYIEKLSLFGINHVYTRIPNKFLRFYLHLKGDSNEEIVSNFSSFGWEAYKRTDYQEAVKWFYLCAEQGDVDTQYNLGLRFANGLGIPQDYNEAIRIWRLAAEQGSPAALGLLGTMYRYGQGVSIDNAEAVKWFRLAAERGIASARYSLGVMYKLELGVPQDSKKAIKWFRLAAEKGDVNVFLKYISSGDIAKEYFPFGWNAYKKKDYQKAIRWFDFSTELENASARYNLGSTFANGLGIPQEDNEAIRVWRLAAEQGSIAALGLLGAMYHHGSGLPKDQKEAMKWFRLAAEKGIPLAIYSVGVMYKRGQGVPQDYKEAVKWFRLAAEQGISLAKFDLGERYASGQGVPQSYKEAIKWLQSASDNGIHTQAKFLLDSILNNQAQKKHSKNRKNSQNIPVITFPYDSEDGLEAYRKKNFKTAYYIWLQLAEQGDAKSQYFLRQKYVNGQAVLQN